MAKKKKTYSDLVRQNYVQGPLSIDALATLRAQACAKTVKRGGSLHVGNIFLENHNDDTSTLTGQLDAAGIIYQKPVENNVVNIVGAYNKDNVLITAEVSVMSEPNGDALPAEGNGQWVNDDGSQAERGNGRWMPNPTDKPEGHPQNPPEIKTDNEETRKKEEEKRKKRNQKRYKKEQNVINSDPDKVLPMYNSDGGIERYEWGNSGDSDNRNPVDTLIGQVELLVRGHIARNPQLAKDFKDNNPYKFKGVLFKDGKADMKEFSMGTVKMKNFSTNRAYNFKCGDEIMAEQLNGSGRLFVNPDGTTREFTAEDVKKYRENHDLTWHEDPSRKQMMKIPSILHGNTTHSGGVSGEKTLGGSIYGDNITPNQTSVGAGNGSYGDTGERNKRKKK